MAFTSASFAIFLVIAFFLYYIFPKKIRWVALLILSYAFYLSAGVGVLKYILFTTLSTYLCGVAIAAAKAKDDTREQKKAAKAKKRLIAAIALMLNFGLLYFVKYWNFTLDVIGVPDGFLRVDILLPLGLSFYIFQSMGYIIDLVREKYDAQRNIFKLALFVSFFPQVTQGPIGRYDHLSAQLYEGNDFSFDNLKEGVKLLMWGYMKKLIVADRAAVVVCAVIDSYTSYSGSVILFAIVLYCLQLYCDFSGGIDIARGAARLFGIEMAHNFKRPLFATSLADFWRRWHITLGSWLKDYLFYPITLSKPFIKLGKLVRKVIKGKAGKILPTSLATFIVYLVIGIWHGASWKYILFGVWNGTLITASLLLEPVFSRVKSKLVINDRSIVYRVFCVIRTNIIIVFGRYITRAEGVTACMAMLGATFTDFFGATSFSEAVMSLGLSQYDFAVILIGAIIIFILEFCDEIGIRLTEKIERAGVIPTVIFVFIAIAVFIYCGIYRGDYIAGEFIYKQF